MNELKQIDPQDRAAAGAAIATVLQERFGEFRVHVQRDDLVRIDVPRKDIIPVLSYLRSETPFLQLTHMTVIDWIEDDEFELMYLVTAPTLRVSLMICYRFPRQNAEAESVFKLWLQAETYEQEINEMYGIRFPDSPRQGIPFILEGWDDIPPMRREFDTVAYCERVHPERPGRSHEDSRAYVGRTVGEKGYLK
jgi:NADH-quinone oxidoreductase subunit C